jgi:hypothetical protein
VRYVVETRKISGRLPNPVVNDKDVCFNDPRMLPAQTLRSDGYFQPAIRREYKLRAPRNGAPYENSVASDTGQKPERAQSNTDWR